MSAALHPPPLQPGDVVIACAAASLSREPEQAALLSAGERTRACRVHPSKRETFAAGRILLRRLLGDALGVAASCVPLEFAPEGPPRPVGPFRLSLAHSGSVVVAAIAHGARVGVDVERVRLLEPSTRLAQRIAGDLAERVLASKDPSRSLTITWTRKEARAKAVGATRAAVLAVRAGVHPDPPSDATGWAIRDFEIGPDVVGAVAVEGPAPNAFVLVCAYEPRSRCV